MGVDVVAFDGNIGVECDFHVGFGLDVDGGLIDEFDCDVGVAFCSGFKLGVGVDFVLGLGVEY